MKSTFFVLIFLVFCSVLNSQVKIKEQIITPGVIHKKILNETDTLAIDILKIDLRKGNFTFRGVKAKNKIIGRETVTRMSQEITDSGYNVIAAINADFFKSDGQLVNNMISEGKYIKASKFTDSKNDIVNSQFAFTFDNKPVMEQFVFSGNLIFQNGHTEEISKLNSQADSNSLTLYDSFQETTPKINNNWHAVEYVVNPIKKNCDTLFFIVEEKICKNGESKIEEGDYILSANNSYVEILENHLNKNDTIRIVIKLNPVCSKIRTLIGGRPRIVAYGKKIITNSEFPEGTSSGFSLRKHPRTGIGFSKDSTTVYFITVDGRQKSSAGITLPDFADLMIQEGIYNGLNLDGGGSTTMVINNKVVNSPSDVTGERTVGNCLLLIKEDN